MSRPSVIASAIAALLIAAGTIAWITLRDDSTAQASTVPKPQLPLRTETVPAPSGGSVEKKVPPRKLAKPTKVALDETADLGRGVEVSLAPLRIRAVKAVGPGNTGGRSVIVTVTITNDSRKPLALDSSWVQLTYGPGRRTAALQPADPYRPLSGSLAPGKTATGTYPFAIGKARPRDVAVLVTHDPAQPRASFVGDLA